MHSSNETAAKNLRSLGYGTHGPRAEGEAVDDSNAPAIGGRRSGRSARFATDPQIKEFEAGSSQDAVEMEVVGNRNARSERLTKRDEAAAPARVRKQ